MSENNKKTLPKFKKKLHGFLSDESGKITKEDVLKMWIIAMWVMLPMNNAIAWHNSHWNYCNWTSASTNAVFGQPTGNSTPINKTYNPSVGTSLCNPVPSDKMSRMSWTIYTNWSVAPYSYIVNGHANGNATIQGWWINGGNINTVASHGSHASHNSHGSHAQW